MSILSNATGSLLERTYSGRMREAKDGLPEKVLTVQRHDLSLILRIRVKGTIPTIREEAEKEELSRSSQAS